MSLLEIRPQPGPQEIFLSTKADIAIYGGAAGGGKTFALLCEPVRHVENPRFSAVIFRREMPMVTNEGGLWDESGKLYPLLGAKPRETDHKWTFPKRSTVRFAHMQHEDDKLNWQGSQIPFIGFDELTHFTQSQFFYMLSRNRSMCGVRPYIRATTNPDATSWVKSFLRPWIDKTYPNPAKSGDIRWMLRRDGVICWYASFAEARDDNPGLWTDLVRPEDVVKSVTFVAARIYDNKILLKENPEYLGNLMALPPVERERLLNGDWDILPEAGKVFDRSWFEVIEQAPAGRTDPVPFLLPPPEAARLARDRQYDVRFWDFAASVKQQKGDDPDWTVGCKLRQHQGRYYVVDLVRVQKTPGDLDTLVRNTATQDGHHCTVRWEEEGGASGKIATNHFIDVLDGFDARGVRPQGDKVTRAGPVASASEAQNVKLVRGEWNEGFLVELHHFPDMDHDDQCDALSGAYNFLSQYGADIVIGPDIWSS